MSWKKPVFMLGAVLLCTSLLLANTPPGQTTATATKVAPAPVQSADAAAVPAKPFKGQANTELTATRSQSVSKGMAGKPQPVTRAITSNVMVPTTGRECAEGEATILIEILTDNYGSETTWDVVEESSGTTVASGGPYDSDTFYSIEVCVDPALCYTFTIYDAFGDGICCSYGEGYYNVYYEGELFCTGGEFGSAESCEQIGVDCVDPCEGNEPPNDLCENAEYVGGPYPVTIPVDPTCATIDCEGLLDWLAVWYEIELPYGMQNVRITTCATEGDVYTTGIILMDDCACDDYIIRDGGDGFITCDNGLQGYDMIFSALPGPGTILFPWYFVDEMETPLLAEITFDVIDTDSGACCVDAVCVDTTSEAACLDMGGDWYQFETCPDFECPTPCEESTIVITITTDSWGYETDWVITDHVSGAEVCSGGNYSYDSNTTYVEQCCIPYDGCVDFTIYDSYGDGIYSPGGYIIELDGVEIANTMGGLFTGSEETVANFGGGCVPDMGACCNEALECVATNTEPECDALGGDWYIFEDCFGDPPFECPEPLPCDDCEDACVVTAPYPVTVSGTNVGANIDCPGLLDWEATWWYFELPYADNDVTITMCSTTDLYTAGIIVMDDCACDDYITSTYIFADPCIEQYWRLEGPGYMYFPAYGLNAAGENIAYDLTFDITEHLPCVVDCEPNEDEEICYDGYDDITNSGCNNPAEPFQTLECGDVICGHSGVFLFNGTNYRDMDWFEFTLDGPAMVTWAAEAEFNVAIWLASGGCDALTVDEFLSAGECEPISISHVYEAGTYIAIISTSDWGAWPCGVKYEATFTCDVITGACCYESGGEILCTTVEEYECDALGGEWHIGEVCVEDGGDYVCPEPCEESQIDILIMTDSWGYETDWEIVDHSSGAQICSGGNYAYESNTLYEERCCIGYEDCVDFIIYDSYGDGIYSPGGYTIILDGLVIYDCMGSGWSGSMETVENFGGGCVVPYGACCVELDCVATNTQPECAALGGRWFEDEDCFGDPPFICPECWDYAVTAPYTSELMSTCGWYDDCSPPSQYNDTEDIVFQVEIPYAAIWNFNTCLDTSFDTWIALGTDCCLEDLGYNDDSCGLQSEIIIYLEPGVYYLDMEGYSTCGNFIFDVHEEIECEVLCPEGGMPENEPCGDDNNGGCNMDDPTFEPIACNDIICGTGWFDGSTRDTDWYEFIATNDDHMTFTVQAEFDVLFGLIEQINPGEPGCDNVTGYLNPYLTMPDCEEASVEFDVVAGGTYYVFVAPQFTDVFTCDFPTIDYYAILTGEACICGDFDDDGDVDELDFYFFLDAFGTCVGDDKYEEVCDFDEDGCITAVDYQIWMQCYRDANGKRFIPPIQQQNDQGGSQGAKGAMRR